jgi:hypothetical protein
VLGPAPGAHSFAGSCATKGDATFTPPAGDIPAPLAYAYEGPGTCTGTLDGRELRDVAVTMRHSGRAEGSCNGARTVAPGRGTLTFADGTVIGYTLEFASTGTEVDARFFGERSGEAPGHGTFKNDRTPSDVGAQCAQGTAARVPLDFALETESPLVSDPPRGGGDAGGGAGSPGGGAPRARRLRVAVTPARVRAGRRTRFAIRVLTGDHRPVRGALVTLAGRRTRTDATGRARLVATVRRSGRVVARASKAGFASGRVAVTARRR